MIYIVDGRPGCGKSFFMTQFLLSRARVGQNITCNWHLNFPEQYSVEQFRDFDEVLSFTGGEKGGIIGLDEAYKVFDARRFMSLPIAFAEKLAEHRHDGVDIITASQNFGDLDKRVRDKVEVWYHCRSPYRFPRAQSIKPLFQWISVAEKRRMIKKDGRVVWSTVKVHNYFLSRIWTKKLYDSQANLKLSDFVSRFKRKKGKWILVIASRNAINRGKVRGF